MKISPDFLVVGRLPNGRYQEDPVDDLVDSIREKGQLQAILVRKKGKDYEVIAGNRRARALKILLAEYPDIQAEVKVMSGVDEEDALQINWDENHERNDATPLDDAVTMQIMLQQYGYPKKKVAEICKVSPRMVDVTVSLLSLPERVKKLIAAGKLDASVGWRQLAGLPDDKIDEVLEQAAREAGTTLSRLLGQLGKKPIPDMPGVNSGLDGGDDEAETPGAVEMRPDGGSVSANGAIDHDDDDDAAPVKDVKKLKGSHVAEAIRKVGKVTPRSLADLRRDLAGLEGILPELLMDYTAGRIASTAFVAALDEIDNRMDDKTRSIVLAGMAGATAAEELAAPKPAKNGKAKGKAKPRRDDGRGVPETLETPAIPDNGDDEDEIEDASAGDGFDPETINESVREMDREQLESTHKGE